MTVEALYLHIPFCHAKCAYCDFDSQGLCGPALEAAAEPYFAALLRRLDAFGARGALGGVQTVYIGGGTPTVLGAHLPELVRRVRRWCDPIEFTCEANPESFTDELAARLGEAGVTRISLGIQSLDDGELRALGRLHDRATALEAVARGVDAGFSVSCDVMCGLPGQTLDSFSDTLCSLIAAGPHHLSVYPLTIEAGTPLAARVARDPTLEPDEDFQATCMESASDLLEAAGFERYEVASYAKPGAACRHNIAYWTGVSYLGLGRSAAGMLSGAAYRELADLFGGAGKTDAIEDDARVRLVQLDDAGTSFDREVLSAREAVCEDLMLGMRLVAGIPRELIERAGVEVGLPRLEAALRQAEDTGLATWHDGRFVPSRRGWLMGNELYGILWDLASDD